MDQMILNWANRYYYTGMGLPAPAKVSENPKYEESFKMLLVKPIAKLLDKGDDLSKQEITDFLRQYQELGVKSPFYTLPYLAEEFSGGSWKAYVTEFVQNTNVCVGVVKDGKAMHVYADMKKALGVFPYAVHIIGSRDIAPQGSDVLNNSIFGIDAVISDELVAALKEICKISKKYEEAILSRKIEIEHFDGGKISTEPIPVISPAFPPYEVRKLLLSLPEANAFSTKHEQAYQYASYSSDVSPQVKEYLARVEKLNVASTEHEAKEEESAEMQVTEEFAEKMQDALIGLPESNEVFNDVGEMLAHLVRTDYIGMRWSICDAIKYYSLPDNDPYVPVDRYDFDEKKLTLANKKVLRQALQDVLNYVDNPQRPMTVEHLIEQLNSKESKIESQNTWDILHACMVLLNVNNNRDVASLKGKEKSFDLQLQRQAVNFIKQGYDEKLTLGDAAKGLVKSVQTNTSIEQIASMAVALGCDADVTIGDMQNGLSKHFEKTATVASLEDLLSSNILPQKEKDRLQKLMDSEKEPVTINTLEDLQKSDVLSDGVKNALTSMMELVKVLGAPDAKSAIFEVHDLMNSLKMHENVITDCNNITAPESSVSEAVSDDFARETAITLLSDIRAGIKEAEKLPILETLKAKSAYVPIYYTFVRLVGCGTNEIESVLQYLTREMEAAENQNTKDILNHGIEVLKTFM